jgi:hypothetical protein
MQPSGLAARASELGVSHDEYAQWEPRLTPGVVAALLAGLIRYEDALRELAVHDGRDTDGAPR